MTRDSSPAAATDRLPRTSAELRGRRALVLGLGRSGVAACRFLTDAGARVTAYDRQSAASLAGSLAALGQRRVDLALGASEHEVRSLLAGAQLVVTSPAVSSRFPTTDAWLGLALAAAEAAGTAVVSEVDLFLRLTRARVLAVTGTKGKTTTASVVASILTAAGWPHALGGNIGIPLIERADALGPDSWAVLELSELQLPTISRGADLALYTNIAADHLDRHPSVAAYQAVKARLAELSVGRGPIVLNGEDPGCVALGERLAGGDLRWYGLRASQGFSGWLEDGWLQVEGRRLLPAAEVPLPGEHMVLNVLGAATACSLLGVPHEAIAAGIRAFRGVPHRLELIGHRHDVSYVDDSQATIPIAAMAGLAAFHPRPVVLIAGGQDKGLDYRELADAIATRCRAVILIGQTADELAALIGDRVPVRRATDMAAAVVLAADAAQPGDVVLLAPAAASFDMFVDYAARGEAFREAAAGLHAFKVLGSS